jgi:uncharacterized protein YbcC (UPF0753/DUF2309 family)
METQDSFFNEEASIRKLKRYLPHQPALKDFIHQNPLHAFQDQKFFDGTRNASAIFGYRVSLSLREYRKLYQEGLIRDDILRRIIVEQKGEGELSGWLEKVRKQTYDSAPSARIGDLRSTWRRGCGIDLDSLVHPILFRVICNYLDQGISIWRFPITDKPFLSAVKEMEENSLVSFFRKKRARNLLLNTSCELSSLLDLLVGDQSLYERYIFDQQFAHQGWSGMISVIEDNSSSLLDYRNLSLRDLLRFELLLEIDALDYYFGMDAWEPLMKKVRNKPQDLFDPAPRHELHEVLEIFQDAFEWTYYDQVLSAIHLEKREDDKARHKSFQSIFCIDDRACSFRRYVEHIDPRCETFGTPGFFNAPFFYQPEKGKFYKKLCPPPITPLNLIKESGASRRAGASTYLTKHSHTFVGGWIISQTLGFWSALRLFVNVFIPKAHPTGTSSFIHMDSDARLSVLSARPPKYENGLQIGFDLDTMVSDGEGLLRNIGLVKDFASIVYVVGHGASSVNNPHYAAYECGACSGRAGSVNARVAAFILNNLKVRDELRIKGIDIPEATQFVAALHDTTRDEITFFDEKRLTEQNDKRHSVNKKIFFEALDNNSKERARRFLTLDIKSDKKLLHDKVRSRSTSLFEPRPELNHATNAVCIVGRRSLSKNLFLDRRAFLNSYDPVSDPDGHVLEITLQQLAVVCGGINLEYFFSRVDNQKLGAGTKLPHNVMGLFGVANGIDGDLRPGLPSQMIEVHNPIRLLLVVEQSHEVVLAVICRMKKEVSWFANEWIRLACVEPVIRSISVFKDGKFSPYEPLENKLNSVNDLTSIFETHDDNLPVYALS